MAVLDELRKKRNPNYSNNKTGIGGAGTGYNGYDSNGHISKSQPQNVQSQLYLGPGNNMVTQVDGMNSLTQGFASMNASFSASNKSNLPMTTQSADYAGGTGLSNGLPQAFMHNGQVMFAGHYLPPQSAAHTQAHIPSSPGVFSNFTPQFVGHNFAAYPHLFNSNSPMSSWPSSRVPSGDMPSMLTPRRDSSSSNENDPGTPFTQYTHYHDYSNGMTVMDHSPNSICTWSTPSPTQTGYSTGRYAGSNSIPHALQVLVKQDPPIPKGVESPSSPCKSLDRCLENRNGVTNVYIRGLQPDTTDEMLYDLAGRFGDIESHKSIIDHQTGCCKGYGFVKFHNFKDAENCIRGFHFMGYETSFARESFYCQLKKLGDEGNTNLYVSNLPKEMNEHELAAIFTPHKVCSARILRDLQGNGRGVGFARFESRTICEEIIKDFNNLTLPMEDGSEYIVQIRYADTQEQKELKRQTTQHRKLRTDEYELMTGVKVSPPRPDQDFERYMNKFAGYPKSSPARQMGQGRGQTKSRLSKLSSQLTPNVNSPTTNVNHPQAHQNSDNASLKKSETSTSLGGGYLEPSASNVESVETSLDA